MLRHLARGGKSRGVQDGTEEIRRDSDTRQGDDVCKVEMTRCIGSDKKRTMLRVAWSRVVSKW